MAPIPRRRRRKRLGTLQGSGWAGNWQAVATQACRSIEGYRRSGNDVCRTGSVEWRTTSQGMRAESSPRGLREVGSHQRGKLAVHCASRMPHRPPPVGQPRITYVLIGNAHLSRFLRCPGSPTRSPANIFDSHKTRFVPGIACLQPRDKCVQISPAFREDSLPRAVDLFHNGIILHTNLRVTTPKAPRASQSREYGVRDVEIESRPREIPPFLSNLLVGRNNQVAARLRNKVARHGGFKVDGWHLSTGLSRG